MDECSTGLNNHLSPTDRFRSYIIEFIRSNDLDDTHQTNSSARVKSVKSSKHNGVSDKASQRSDSDPEKNAKWTDEQVSRVVWSL